MRSSSIPRILCLVIVILVPFSKSIASGDIEYVNEISQSYGYCFGQNYSLDIIKNEFQAFQQNLISQIESVSNPEVLSKDQAISFLEIVRRRAKGEIHSPVFETLLSCHPTFIEHPEQELLKEYINIYRSKGHPKAEGLDVQIEYPKSWKQREGKRPHIVQFFRNQYGHGSVMMSLIVNPLPDDIAKELTDNDIKTLFSDKNELKDMAQPGSKILEIKTITMDNQPGALIIFEWETERIDKKQKMITHQYMTMYEKKYIMLSLAVRDASGDDESLNKTYQRYKKLFWLIANSLIIQNQYNKY